ncbi:MAG: SUMF1/EgtB/PvdO family nonheme iron enzyme [Prevotellaceae bacterium]|jgi:gliding motility-associated lipoprotein GldK|nr:SUMF1/EgtB/PvdO family nonheme iron enzyme [Prevotellaceae bacterium]
MRKQNIMKKFVILLSSALLLWDCGAYDPGYGGSLQRGTKGRALRYVEMPPPGMVYIPSGSFLLGMNDQDITQALNASVKTITIDAFWMDQTEITNFEYRQFVNYVKDSTSRRLLSEQFEQFVIENESATEEEQPQLNWRARINYRDEEQQEILNSMNYSVEEALLGRREVDVRRLVYEYAWIDVYQAAKTRYDYDQQRYVGTIINASGEVEDVKNRSSFIVRDRTLIYPDTLCWIRDFIYSYNDPFATRYFWHPAYNDYPVVGVTWKQASAFCRWRTDIMENSRNKYLKGGHGYRLPSEVEWEYASRGGLQGQLYPWGGPYTTNKEGCYLANFKPQRGKYSLDGGVRTVPVGSYDPNDFGLYDMAGNVAEWTANAYDENAYSFYHDMVPSYTYNAKATDPAVKKRKAIRGGSWKDIAYFLQCGVRTFEYQDSARSFIGFRCVRDYMGSR